MLGRDATFTGRTDIWDHITLDTVNPVIGAGFWNFWGGPGGQAIGDALDTNAVNAHQGYLDIYIDGGFIGLGILLVMLLSCGRRLIRTLSQDRYHRLKFAFLIITLFADLTESHFGRPSLTWFTMLLLVLDFPYTRPENAVAEQQQEEEMQLPAGAEGGVAPAAVPVHRAGHFAV